MLTVADLSPWFLRGFAFLFGAAWGSFFNVAIYRWPRDMSVVTPPSHCPHCGAPVPPSRNLPILSYLASRGHARCCGARLTPRYVWVETLTALLATAVVEAWMIDRPEAPLTDAALAALTVFLFVGGLVIASAVDLEWMEIPDEVSLPGAAVGLVSAGFRPEVSATDAALGAGTGFLIVQVLFVWGYERLTGRRGMGEGDSKLLLFIGAFLGWQGALFTLVAGSMQGLVASVILQLTGRDLSVQESHQAYGRLDVPGGYLFIDVGRVRIGSDVVGQVFAQDGRFELTIDREATVPTRLAAPAGTVETDAGTSVAVAITANGSIHVEVEQGRVVLRWFDGEAMREVPVTSGAAATLSVGGTLEGPEDVARLARPTAESAVALSATSLASHQTASRARLEQLVGDGAKRPELLLASERLQAIHLLAGVDADTPLVRDARRLLGTASEPPNAGPAEPAPAATPFLGRKLPFGPFLSLAALEFLFFGPTIVEWYVTYVGSGVGAR